MTEVPMIELHPEILRKDGQSEFVVFPYDEFVKLQELLEDSEICWTSELQNETTTATSPFLSPRLRVNLAFDSRSNYFTASDNASRATSLSSK
jgi:hypothetical protein